MKTIPSRKLTLDTETLRTLTGDKLGQVVGGQAEGIISTDTPSFCIKDAPLCHKSPKRPRPKC